MKAVIKQGFYTKVLLYFLACFQATPAFYYWVCICIILHGVYFICYIMHNS